MQQQLDQKFTYKRTFSSTNATILSGQTTSGVVDLGGMQIRGILFPSNWTNSNMTFFGSIVPPSQTTFFQWLIYNFDGAVSAPLTLPTAASGWFPLFAHWFDAVPYVELSCDVAQATDSIVTLVLEPIYQGIHG